MTVQDDKEEGIDIIYMGSRKAFDFIQHDIFINKLGRSGPDHGAVRWKHPPPRPASNGKDSLQVGACMSWVQQPHLGILFGGGAPCLVGHHQEYFWKAVCQSGGEGKYVLKSGAARPKTKEDEVNM